MNKVLIIAALTLFVLCEARPGVVTPKPVEIERSVEAEEKHVRVRRNFDYGDYMSQFWNKWGRCTGTDCDVLNVGNGYKNRNEVHMGKRQKSGRRNNALSLNMGNGYKNDNELFIAEGQNVPYGTFNIGNGRKNTNKVYFGVRPGSVNGDPFSGQFWEN